MTARRHRSQREAPRGVCLAFLALAMQVLVPFFMAVEIARAEVPGGAAVICSALGHETKQSGHTTDRGLAEHCSICTTLAATHAFTPSAAPPLPLPVSVGNSDLTTVEVAQVALLITSSYQSRGPPSIV